MGLVLLLAGSNGAYASQSPTESVQETIGGVTRILNDEALKQPERLEERRQKIEQLVRYRVSYEDMAKRALGKSWASLSTEAQKEFVDLFVQLLRDSFAGKIDAYTDEEVVYLSEVQNERFAEVRTKLSGRKLETLLDFRLVHRSGTWLVYDVVIDGASVVHNFRSQFTRIIRDVSYAGLVKQMRQKAVVVKSFEAMSASSK